MRLRILLPVALVAVLLLVPARALAHCDTMDGPVVLDAKAALENKDVTAVLKWVKKDDEAQVRAAFARTLTVRDTSPQARELADQYFFETVVRVHRAGEGAPFTGLKPAGTQVDRGIRDADEAVSTGSVETLVRTMQKSIAAEIQRRFAEVQEKKKHAADSVGAGRQYVAAYVEYIHYVEGLERQLAGPGHSPETESPSEGKHTEAAAHGH